MSVPRILAVTGLVTAALLAVTGCATEKPAAEQKTPAAQATVTIEDNNGSHEIVTPPASVVATDNRTFQTLSDWGIELQAAAVSLMPETVAYRTQDGLIDLGTHMEPDLESVVAVQPDLIVNGQRFTQHHDALAKLVPDATILELDPREGEPLDAELKRQITVLGEVFGKQAEAKKLNDDFDAAVARAKKAYDESATVMAVNTSGGQIGYIAPKVGRTLGPVFELLGLTPALQVDGATDDHQGDDISVEAIAKADPDWILVMDRDASFAVKDTNYVPAAKILETEALKNVTAVKNAQVVYMPADTYLNEGIQTYTTFLNDLA
ncbi:MAG: ABC transporter substrate-binding protein, partial [Microbacterium sp.]